MFNRLIFILALLAAPSVLAAEHTQDGDEAIKASLASQKAVLIDVREADEWASGHLKDAIHVPLSAIKAGKVDALPKGKTLYLHCQSGRRVLFAADILKEAKFSDVRPLAAGYPDLLKKGFAPAP